MKKSVFARITSVTLAIFIALSTPLIVLAQNQSYQAGSTEILEQALDETHAVPEAQTPQIKERNLSPCFSAMYDSDDVFLEEAERILQQELNMTELGYEPGIGRSSELSSPAESYEYPIQALSAVNRERDKEKTPLLPLDIRTLLEDIQEEGPSILDDYEISEQTCEMLERLYADSRIDRYIVKYKDDQTGLDIESAITEQVLSSNSLSELEEDSELSVSSPARNMSGCMEVIVLSEKVNPIELAAELEAAGMAKVIEYIQPDFTMSYAEIDSEGSEPVDEGEEDPGTGTEEQGESEEETVTEDPLDEPLTEDPEEELEEETDNDAVIIALIDTGVDTSHPAIADFIVDGWNFVDNTSIVYDSSSPLQSAHGTHIAGIIAANGGENVKIMPLKVFGAHGAYTSDIIAAIGYAEENGASIVNASFGSGAYNPALKEAIEASGMLFVASVGNARSDLRESPVYPAAFDQGNIISVASLNEDKGFSYYSNYSDELVDISAYGRDVMSALPEGEYGLHSGTSMAAGFVSAAAGLVLSENAYLTAEELKERLCGTGERLAHLQSKVQGGRSLDVLRALSGVRQEEILTISPADDFDVQGYAPTPEDSWALFSSKTIVSVSAGESHSLALCSDGTVWAWGINDYGQLGDGTKINRSTTVQVIGLTDVTAIAAGFYNNLALKQDGTVWAWGSNSSHPVQVSGLNDVTDIAAGDYHRLAKRQDGTVWAWGNNSYGQLGDGTKTDRYIPVQVSGLTDATSIAVGYYHSLASK